jgi:hypothetical protein
MQPAVLVAAGKRRSVPTAVAEALQTEQSKYRSSRCTARADDADQCADEKARHGIAAIDRHSISTQFTLIALIYNSFADRFVTAFHRRRLEITNPSCDVGDMNTRNLARSSLNGG